MSGKPVSRPVKRVLIAGGGTAGWLTAGILASCRHGGGPELEVTLVESSDIPTIGVGEGTWPTIRNTLRRIGLSENEFLHACNGTFKQASKFQRWVRDAADDFYYHPFTVPEGYGRVDLARLWLQKERHKSFAESVCFQYALCQAGLAPKTITDVEYEGPANYAYHLDAGRFASLLKEHCIGKLGVRHVVDTIGNVELNGQGAIGRLWTGRHGALAADLYVDCTGFASLLLGKAMGIGFVDHGDKLFCNRALAVQVPYQDADAPVASQTVSTAHKAGWIWDIGLTNRRGIGCVYAADYLGDDEAEAILRAYTGPLPDDCAIRRIAFRSGHRECFWQHNCVAIGLSAGFLEPLEASAILLIELSAHMLADNFPVDETLMASTAHRFNSTFLYRWERILEFLKLHYALSRRQEPFWQDNRRVENVPSTLQEKLEIWQYRPPSDYDFDHRREVFPPASYQYVLYGMGFGDRVRKEYIAGKLPGEYYRVQERSRQRSEQAVRHLPPHRELLDKVARFGFQTI